MSTSLNRQFSGFLKYGSVIVNSRCQSTAVKVKPPKIPNDQFLHSGNVRFEAVSGKPVEIKSVWQDNMPSGSALGTVVAFHGAPGSHNDYKYVEILLREKGIRLVALNAPGMGYSTAHEHMGHCNEDRDRFLSAMVEHLNLDKLIWMGHSRGNENALRCVVRHASKSKGVVLLNATGLRPHRGIRPYWLIKTANKLYWNVPLVSALVNPGIKAAYAKFGMNIEDPEIGARCLAAMDSFSLGDMATTIEEFNRIEHLTALQCFAGRDPLIELPITYEFVEKFEDADKKLVDSTSEAEAESTKWAVDRINSGRRMTSVGFKNDGHYLQKFRANLISEAIEAMLRK